MSGWQTVQQNVHCLLQLSMRFSALQFSHEKCISVIFLPGSFFNRNQRDEYWFYIKLVLNLWSDQISDLVIYTTFFFSLKITLASSRLPQPEKYQEGLQKEIIQLRGECRRLRTESHLIVEENYRLKEDLWDLRMQQDSLLTRDEQNFKSK